MRQSEFLKLLTRIVNLYQRAKIYNTSFISFSYELIEKNGQLILYIQYPNIDRKIKIHSNEKIPDSVELLIDDVEKFIKQKEINRKQYSR